MRLQPYSEIDVRVFSSNNQPDMEKLAGLLNPFLSQFNRLFNKNIGLDNLSFSLITAIVEVDSNGVPKQSLILPKQDNVKFNGLVVIRVEKLNPNDTFITAYPFPELRELENGVQILKLLGVPANIRYRFTFLLI